MDSQFRCLAPKRKHPEHAVFLGLFFLAALSPVYSQPVSIGFNSTGLSSVLFNGTQFLSYGDFRLDQVTFQNPDGSTSGGSTSSAVAVDAVHQTQTRTYAWGTIVIAYTATGNRLSVSVTVNNQSSAPISQIWLEPFGLQFPSAVQEFSLGYPLIVNTIGQPGVQSMSFGSGVMVLADDNVSAPLQLGFPWSFNSPANTVFPLTLNTGRVNSYPNQYLPINRPIPAGGSDQYQFSLRFGPPGSTSMSLAGDVYQAYAAAFPSTLNWPDRRPIGALFLGTDNTGWPTNPRGWLFDPTVDVTTPPGIAALKTRILAYADTSIGILQGMNAQGMVTWDIEGDQFAHPITYIGDPTLTYTLAPEMTDIADAYFQKFRDAGLRVGVTIRPQQLVFPTTGPPQQVSVADPTQLLINKVSYAINHWGATLFYVDSNVNANDPNPIDVNVFRTLTTMFPGVLFIPEHANLQYYAYTAPYKELRQGYTSTASDVRFVYPRSFTVIYTADGPIQQNFNQLVTAVQQGDLLLFRGWWPDPQNALDLSIYQAAGQGTVSPTITFSSPANGNSVTNTITVSAVPSAGSASITSVHFQLDGVSLGGPITAPPYSISWNTTQVTNGSHSLAAVVTDSLGHTGNASITVTVSNPVPPTVTFTSPNNGSTVSNTIALSASASGSASIAGVQFQLDGSNLGGPITVPPYSISWNTTQIVNGSHTLKAVATDALNQSASASVTVTVSNVLPTVTFTSPNNGSTVSNTIALSASASGSASITGVQFQLDGSNLGGPITVPPYSISWNTTQVVNGSHTLKAVATDALNQSASASLMVTVSNTVPVISVSVSPLTASLVASQTLQFTPAVTGTTNQQVTWSIVPAGMGSISAAGLYTAPASIVTQQIVTIRATSVADPTKSASATVTLNPPPPPPVNGYAHSRSITISHSKVPNTDQANFPVLIQGVYPYLANIPNGGSVQSSNGFDIIFATDSAGTQRLKWEIESYTGTTGSVAFWVQVPTLSHTTDTTFYMLYGNPSVSTFQGNTNGTWASNYAAVYHLGDNAANRNVIDSTSNANTGTAQVNTSAKTTTAGEIGGALRFDGSSDYINSGRGSSLTITGNITLEAWVYANSMPNLGGQAYLLDKGYNGSNEAYFLRLETDNNGTSYVEAGTYSFPQPYQAQVPVTGFSGKWHHVAGTYSGTWNVYVDGIQTTSSQTQGPLNSNEPFVMGARDATGGILSLLNGTLDEVRVSSVARSADWILTEYNNQSNPPTFYSIGAEH
jgi:hypothetical protein